MTTEATTSHVLGEATLAELEQGLHGRLIRPGDGDYDEARVTWNGAHDKRPALIVRCAGVSDVMQAVDFALQRGPGHRGPRRRPLAARLLELRRGRRDRPVRDEVGARGPRTSRRRRRRWLHLGGLRPRDAGLRARGDRRPGVEHRHRRLHPRRRHRLADAQARAGVRQPDRCRRRDRRRTPAPASEDENPELLSGACAAAAATSGSPRRSSSGCIRSARRCWPARSSLRATAPRRSCASIASGWSSCRTR